MPDTKKQTELLRQVRVALQNRDYPNAIQYLKQTAELAHETGDIGAEGRHLGNLALIYYRLNQPTRALEHFELALAKAREDEDQATENGLLGNMGNILRELQRYDEAIDYLNYALSIAHKIGDVRGRGIWMSNLGLVYDDLKQPEKAVQFHAKAVAIARELHDQRGLTSRLTNLGNAHVALNDYVSAIQHFKEVVELHTALGDQTEVALRLGIIGNLYNELGRHTPASDDSQPYFTSALDYYGQTLTIARELEDVISEAQLLRSIGTVFVNLNHYEKASEYLNSALQMFDVLGLDEDRDRTQKIIRHVTTLKARAGHKQSED